MAVYGSYLNDHLKDLNEVMREEAARLARLRDKEIERAFYHGTRVQAHARVVIEKQADAAIIDMVLCRGVWMTRDDAAACLRDSR